MSNPDERQRVYEILREMKDAYFADKRIPFDSALRPFAERLARAEHEVVGASRMTTVQRDEPKPKPCPFCSRLPQRQLYPHSSCAVYVCVGCNFPRFDIENWNTRPIEDTLRAQIAELEAQLRKPVYPRDSIDL